MFAIKGSGKEPVRKSIEEAIETPPLTTKTPRLTSLDAFRGATVALMLLVNNLALDAAKATPTQLVHAPFGEWARLADLVFPWFLLCAGLSMPFSYRSAKRRGTSYGGWTRKGLGRATGLLLLGMLLDSSVNHRPTFGLGVLQLIGLASLVAALLMPLKPVVRGLIAAGLLGAYGAALAWIPVPTHGRTVLTEHANLVLYLNEVYFRPLGLRGLPSVVPTSALVLMGSLVGEALAKPQGRLRVFLSGLGLAGVGAGWFLMGHPMAKAIWTAPYILFSGGLGTAIVGVLSALLDGRPWAILTAPLNVFGANPLIAYAGPILVKTLILQNWTISDGRTIQEAWLETMMTRFGAFEGGWAYTLGYIALTWIVLAWMRRKGMVLRL